MIRIVVVAEAAASADSGINRRYRYLYDKFTALARLGWLKLP